MYFCIYIECSKIIIIALKIEPKVIFCQLQCTRQMHSMTPMAITAVQLSKELSNNEHTMAGAMLIGRLQNECLPYESIRFSTFCMQQR